VAGSMKIVIDGATNTVHKFAIPSGTKTQRLALSPKEGEYAQLIFTDGGTGDTTSWGLRSAVVLGLAEDRDVDLA